MKDQIVFYGTRGSSPVMDEAFSCYGGETSCYVVTLDDTAIMVDCGTGVKKATEFLETQTELHLLITHTHLDHIGGIFELANRFKGGKIHIYGRTSQGKTIAQQLGQLMGPPLWPVSIDEVHETVFHDIPEDGFSIGPVQITTMVSNHPGECTLYRLSGSEHSVVIGTDFNHCDGYDEKLVRFAKDCSLLVYDGGMTTQEYSIHGDWGHSTPEMGEQIGRKAGAGQIAISHHGVQETDNQLNEEEHILRAKNDRLFYAFDGLNHKIGAEIPGFCAIGQDIAADDRLKNLIDICTELTTQRDKNKLFEYIVRAAMSITKADGGTFYTTSMQGLEFRAMITKSQGIFKGGTGEPINLPPVHLELSNVCAAAAITHHMINIPDVYDSTKYDFSGPRRYDQMTGYRTKSVMVVPMEGVNGEVVGVLQLINSTNDNGQVVPFDEGDENMVQAIASQAGISLTNLTYAKQISSLLYGFVQGISTGIDARTPYNANHTRNMVAYCAAFLDYEKASLGPYAMTETEAEELKMSIWLHDMGKLTTPLEVMNKPNRLGEVLLERVNERFARRALILDLEHAKGELSEEEYLDEKYRLDLEKEFILTCDTAGFLTDDKLERIKLIGQSRYREADGTMKNKLTEEEIHELQIRKGTLTAEERQVMQEHVSVTEAMLSKLQFPTDFRHVTSWAATHHEFLDGTGYPNHLTAEDLMWQARLITILDIFEALTAADRPYRRSMPIEKAFDILDSMVEEGKLDGNLLDEFKRSNAWVETMRQRELQKQQEG